MNCLDCEHQRSVNSNIVWLDLSKFKHSNLFNQYKPIIVCGEDGIECKTHNYSSCSSFVEKKYEYIQVTDLNMLSEAKHIEDMHEEDRDEDTEEDSEELQEIEGLNF